MTIHKILHPRHVSDVIYQEEKEKEDGFGNFENSMDASIPWLENHIKNNEGIITALTTYGLIE